jgi:hypothetical protein
MNSRVAHVRVTAGVPLCTLTSRKGPPSHLIVAFGDTVVIHNLPARGPKKAARS